MKMTFQKLVIGASMAIGVSALASAPAHAVSFEFKNTGEINTYTGGSNGTFIKGNAQAGTSAAIKALTDNDPSSNVELWYSSETPAPSSYAGFTAKEGNYSATVSSITADDWKIFGSEWLDNLLNTYTDFQTTWKGFSGTTQSLITSSFSSLGMGDPNIGSFQFGQNGGVGLTLVGHLDVKTQLSATVDAKLTAAYSPTVKLLLGNKDISQLTVSYVDSILSPLLALPNALKQQPQYKSKIDGLTSLKDLLNLQVTLKGYTKDIGASEIAKVVTGDKTYYAYSFKSTVSGITASDDGVSYSAYYTWKTPGYTDPLKQVPEPSIILGLLGVAGVFATQRKFKKASI